MSKNITFLAAIIFAMLVLTSSAFAISIGIQPRSLNPGTFAPGQWSGSFPINPNQYGEQGLVVAAASNMGVPWYFKMRITQPLTNTTYPNKTIANSNFHWWGWTVPSESAGNISNFNNGIDSNGQAYNYVDTTVRTIYIAAGRDMGVPGQFPAITKVHFQYGISVPDNARVGSYSTMLEFTVTE